jgi:hypothetical protein
MDKDAGWKLLINKFVGLWELMGRIDLMDQTMEEDGIEQETHSGLYAGRGVLRP